MGENGCFCPIPADFVRRFQNAGWILAEYGETAQFQYGYLCKMTLEKEKRYCYNKKNRESGDNGTTGTG